MSPPPTFRALTCWSNVSADLLVMCTQPCVALGCPAVVYLHRSVPDTLSGHLCRLGVAPDEPALSAFQTRTPLLIVGSHAWNKPYNDAGDMVCGAQQQRAILAAAGASKWVAVLAQGRGPQAGVRTSNSSKSPHDIIAVPISTCVVCLAWLWFQDTGPSTRYDICCGGNAVEVSASGPTRSQCHVQGRRGRAPGGGGGQHPRHLLRPAAAVRHALLLGAVQGEGFGVPGCCIKGPRVRRS